MTSHNFELMPDAEVVTSDGDKIGTVRETSGEYFKVSASMQPDYWLRRADVSDVVGHRVILMITKDRLGDHKVDDDQVRAA